MGAKIVLLFCWNLQRSNSKLTMFSFVSTRTEMIELHFSEPSASWALRL
ncbi:unnamed protein product [Staurois parvus]|uniref:Uncharacterized protein n=1 Tax=Staurois parvus TaxID=386267 RepID=A0ABN9HW13_9NEOB|nr:unnamed protein product [Staurois parvus]